MGNSPVKQSSTHRLLESDKDRREEEQDGEKIVDYNAADFKHRLLFFFSIFFHLRFPQGVAFDGEENLVVADSGNWRIVVYDQKGNVLRQTESQCGPNTGELDVPEWVCVTEKNEMVVSERGNHRVSVFAADGTFRRTFGSRGRNREHLYEPAGVAVDELGRVAVADRQNNRVQVFTIDGTHQMIISSTDKLFSLPHGVAFNSVGDLYVVDDSVQVKVFDQQGRLMFVFGLDDTGKPIMPYGWKSIAIDRYDRILIASVADHRIFFFAAAGDLIGTRQLGFEPSGIAVSSSCTLAVVEGSESGNVHLFKPILNKLS